MEPYSDQTIVHDIILAVPSAKRSIDIYHYLKLHKPFIASMSTATRRLENSLRSQLLTG